ncbi:hypothetical protein Tco_0940304 [Tanacetum coccineum]|uniref:Uncharacterized protein n=1 Tax=Tanacetum coccineum TaxID=301880 RepID=A0ABQ5DTR3_9ASTR
MVSESSSQSQQQITRASNVHFECDDGIIAYNKVIAFLEHQNKLYQPMLYFLSNSCISTALTKQPSAYYAEYIGEFWYSVKVDAASFKTLLASEVALTFHMMKVAKLLLEPEETFILPFRGVNADDIDDKSLSETAVQPHAEELVATTKATKSVDASVLAGELGNQPQPTDAKKVAINLNIRGTASNHSQTSLGESGEDKGYPEPIKSLS